jgi:drug/metabolite transporter (DMT)-like permease
MFDIQVTLTGIQILFLSIATPWVLFALFSAFGDASVGFIDEWLLNKVGDNKNDSVDAPGRLILISGFFGIFVSIFAIFLSLITGDLHPFYVSNISFGYAFAAGLLEVVWLIPYFYALNRGGAINTTPLFQTIPIFSLIIGLLFFGEIPIPIHILATLLIISGAYLLNYSPTARKLDFVTIGYMFVASAVISLGFFLFKDATESGNFVASLFGNGLGMTTLSLLIYILWTPYRKQFNDFIRNSNFSVFLIQSANETLYSISTIANQLAIVLGPSVMVVTAFNAFHPIFTLTIGWLLAKAGSKIHADTLSGKSMSTKTIAILLIAIGTAIIAFQ